jgi:hypothetical protein
MSRVEHAVFVILNLMFPPEKLFVFFGLFRG